MSRFICFPARMAISTSSRWRSGSSFSSSKRLLVVMMRLSRVSQVVRDDSKDVFTRSGKKLSIVAFYTLRIVESRNLVVEDVQLGRALFGQARARVAERPSSVMVTATMMKAMISRTSTRSRESVAARREEVEVDEQQGQRGRDCARPSPAVPCSDRDRPGRKKAWRGPILPQRKGGRERDGCRGHRQRVPGGG